MKVLYFAQAAQIAGSREEIWSVEGPIQLTEFWQEVLRRHPGLETVRPTARVARNHAFANLTDTLLPDDEIAIIPPVSGG